MILSQMAAPVAEIDHAQRRQVRRPRRDDRLWIVLFRESKLEPVRCMKACLGWGRSGLGGVGLGWAVPQVATPRLRLLGDSQDAGSATDTSRRLSTRRHRGIDAKLLVLFADRGSSIVPSVSARQRQLESASRPTSCTSRHDATSPTRVVSKTRAAASDRGLDRSRTRAAAFDCGRTGAPPPPPRGAAAFDCGRGRGGGPPPRDWHLLSA